MKAPIRKNSFVKLKLLVPVIAYTLSEKFNLPLPYFFRRWASRVCTNLYANSTYSRPISHTLDSKPFLTWSNLTNKSFFARHLPAAEEYNEELEKNKRQGIDSSVENVADGFIRTTSFFREGRSNLFFAFFAQWFTDGFFRSSLIDPQKTGSNHHVDLCQIYGLDETTTHCLRLHENGYLRYQGQKGEELPPHLFKKTGDNYEVEPHFEDLSYLREISEANLELANNKFVKNELELVIARIFKSKNRQEFEQAYRSQKPTLLATGLERGNATIGNLALNTMFLRSHNRLCDDLIKLEEFKTKDSIDEEKVFQTARAINTVLLIKYTIEEYINHVAGRKLFIFDPSYAEQQNWYREPWLSAEFNLIYRWHGLVPNHFNIKPDAEIGLRESPSEQMKKHGMNSVLISACKQAAGLIQAGNTPAFLKPADKRMISLGREWKLQPYNEYRKAFGLKPLTSIDKLTKSPRIRDQLKSTYGSIENVEFIAGVYSEDPYMTQLVGELQSTMVAYDAFTQLYTNPLVSNRNYQKLIGNSVAKDWIQGTTSLDELIAKISGRKGQGDLSFNNPCVKDSLETENDLRGTSRLEEQAISSCPNNKLLSDLTTSKEQFGNVLCPHLRIGIRTGNLQLDKGGWIKKGDLRNFLNRVGLKRNTLLTKILIFGGSNNSPKHKRGLINLTSFKNTFLDHGSSSGILNNDEGLISSRLTIFKNCAQSHENEERLYTEQLRKVSLKIHNSPANFQAGFSGQYLQLLELKIILEVYGRMDDLVKQKYFTYDDVVSIWKYAKAPRGWTYPGAGHLGLIWTIKTLYLAYLQYRKNQRSLWGAGYGSEATKQSNRNNL
jgi:prostaglandin-endoperoxide synthase 2